MKSIERLNLDKHREGTSGQRSSKHLKTSHVRQINPFNTIGGQPIATKRKELNLSLPMNEQAQQHIQDALTPYKRQSASQRNRHKSKQASTTTKAHALSPLSVYFESTGGGVRQDLSNKPSNNFHGNVTIRTDAMRNSVQDGLPSAAALSNLLNLTLGMAPSSYDATLTSVQGAPPHTNRQFMMRQNDMFFPISADTSQN